MTRYTSFLVLERESDYARWGINRKLRQQYWKPAEAVVSLPYPQHVEDLLKTPPPERKQPPATRDVSHTENDKEIDSYLNAAKKALQADEPALAQRYRIEINGIGTPDQQAKVDELSHLISLRLDHFKSLTDLGLQRGQFDLSHSTQLPESKFFPYLMGVGSISDTFRQRHPFADKMIQRIKPPQTPMTVANLREMIVRQTRTPVIVDEIELSNDGRSVNDEIFVGGIHDISLRNFLHHALSQLHLTYATNDHVIEITTELAATGDISTKRYPIVDLVRTDQLPNPELLANPYHDIEQRFEERVQSKLKKLVTVEKTETTLEGFVDWLDGQLEENLVVDHSELSNDGRSIDDGVEIPELNNVPLKAVVEIVLGPLQQQLIVDREVLKITTDLAATNDLESRVYSGVGIVYDIPHAVMPRERSRWGGFQGGGGAGFIGGGAGGGFGGGFGGQLGGFGGGGGTGNGMSGLGTGNDSSPAQSGPINIGNETSLSQTGNPVIEGATDEIAELESEEDLAIPLSPVIDLGQLRSVNAHLDLIMDETSGPWIEIDQDGGDISYLSAANLFAVRQTEEVHDQVNKIFSELRSAPAAGRRVRPVGVPLITEDMPAGWSEAELVDLIYTQTRGPWWEIDQDGGDISIHHPTMLLMIRQTQAVHEEIERLLTALRRGMLLNRYQSQLLESGQPLPSDLRWDSGLALTTLPIHKSPHNDGVTDEELTLLEVRQFSPSLQTWRRVENNSEELKFTWDGTRLQLTTQRIEARAEGELGTVTYKGLSVAEHGEWGEAIRILADSMLPWQPHRTNRELAAQYEITLKAETDDKRTLQLRHRSSPKSRLELTYSRVEPGQLLAWKAFVADELQYSLRINVESNIATVVAEDSSGKTLAKWTGTESSEVPEINSLLKIEKGTFVVDQTKLRTGPFEEIRQALNAYDYPAAATVIETQLKTTPQQPFLNFLLAWCCENSSDQIPNRMARQEQALGTVLTSSAYDLINLTTIFNFQGINDRETLELLLATPAEKRSVSMLESTLQLAMKLKRPHVALELHDDIQRVSADVTDLHRLQRIDLLLKTGKVDTARHAAEEFVEKHQAEPTERRVEIYADLANRFAFHGELEIGQQFFQQAIDLNTDSNKEYHLLSSFAVWTSGPMRLRYLSQAADLNPQKSIQQNVQLQMLLNELRVNDLKLLKELIDAAGRRSVQTELIVKQAELIIDDTEAAKVIKELFEKQRIYTREQIRFIPDWRNRLFYEKREDWALRLLTRGGEHAYVIGHFENRLRNGERLDISSLRILADAYQIDGQRVNENRARIWNDSAAGPPQIRSPGFF